MRFLEGVIRTGSWHQRLVAYHAYLDSIRPQLPPNVYDFAIAEWHYNPDFPQSLHDSWVESVSIIESPIRGNQHNRTLDITIRLFGPYHDGHIRIDYKDVYSYSINLPGGTELEIGPYRHGDWLVDEVSLSERNLVVHEIEFRSGSRWMIESRDITCVWKPLK